MLLLSQPRPDELADALATGVRITVASSAFVDDVARAADAAGRRAPVHLKVDTGMHRIGVTPAEAVDVARAIVASDSLELEGVWTHCAVADDPEDPRSEEHTSELQSLMRISYAVFCLKNKTK